MKILYFAPIPYDELRQRPQYLADGLSKEHDVTYVEPTVSLMKYVIKGGERPNGCRRNVSESLHILRLSGWMTAHRSFEAVSPLLCASEKRQLTPLLRQADLVWIGYAPWFYSVRDFTGRIVYDKMDEDRSITKNELLRKLIEKVEPKLIERADTVFVTAQRFYEEIRPQKEHTFLVRNAVDMSTPKNKQVAIIKKPGTRVFGYVGMISHWFDMDAIRTILESNDTNRVVLVGPTEIPRLTHPRLTYTGAVPKKDVDSWIESFDVCLYPFCRTDFLDTIDPVKIYEYLAHNKPILAVDSAEIRKFGDKVYRYRDQEELCARLLSHLPVPFGSETERDAFVAENTWEQRMQDIKTTLFNVSE